MIELYSWTNEKLLCHLILTFQFYEKIFEKRVTKILASRLGTKICDDFVFLIRLVPLMHDVGKAHPDYQRRLKKGRRPLFSWHEILSAQIYWRITESFLFNMQRQNKTLDDVRKIGVTSIVFHHQAMRDIEVGRCPFKVNLLGWNVMNLSGLLTELLAKGIKGLRNEGKSIHSFLSNIKEMIDSALTEFRRDIEIYRNIEGIRKKLFEDELRTFGASIKLYSIIAGPLVICDWMAARKSRGADYKPPLIKEVELSFPELGKI